MTKNIITKRQKEVLQIIYDSLKDFGFPPSFSELKEQLNISSNQSLLDLLLALERKNLITREQGSARGIKILKNGYKAINAAPLAPIAGITSAGSFTEAIEEIDGWVPLSDTAAAMSDNIIITRVIGDSMLKAGLEDGDLILFQKTQDFASGDIVLAKTPEGTTVKRFVCQNKPPYQFLKPENPKYPIITFTDEMEIVGRMIKKL